MSSSFALLSSIGACCYLATSISPATNTSYSHVSHRILVKAGSIMLVLVIGLCMAFGAFYRITAVYRDAPLPELTTQITSGPATGLFTTPQSKQWYDGCYEAITRYGSNANGVFVGVLFPTGYLMTPGEVISPRVWRTALDAADLEKWYALHEDKRPDFIFIKDNDLWGFDCFPDDSANGAIGTLISSGDYEKHQSFAGQVYVKREEKDIP